ncbi:hypothetical protein M0805_001002 [Coniferiporia weirii]|nr:hypothetical protein M0805_001002 [Coniferiporia weirii]
MEKLIKDYEEACQGLNRAAANIREQLSIILISLRSKSHGSAEQALRTALGTVIPKLKQLCQASPLVSYLKQGEVAGLLDDLYDSCWAFVQSYEDDLVREDIEAHREIYVSERRVDSVNLRRLLRDCLRRDDLQQLLINMTRRELLSIQGAVKLEMSMSSAHSGDVRLYQDFLSRLGRESEQAMRARRSKMPQDLTGKIVRISNSPVAWGAACTVWTGELYGKRVTLHSPNPPSGLNPARTAAEAEKNSAIWASFDHPNVLTLLGIYRDFNKQGIALVSPWMENQTTHDYIRNNPRADRLRLITEIAAGLAYLHGRTPPYIHGLLTGFGVLVNEEGKAIVGGFASATFDKGWMTPLRWLAPENTKRETFAATVAADTYSFAMTALQILTTKDPFEEIRSPVQLLEALERGERPARPEHRLIHHGLDDRLWELITRCWSQDPNARPPMEDVLTDLEKMRELPALDVQDLTRLITLPMGSGLNAVMAGGAFGDIRVGTLEDVGRVALKALHVRNQTQTDIRLTKRFIREASIWNRLKHPNILPFLGTADPPDLPTCLVSPWMSNGNSVDYLTRHPEVSPLYIARGIARGLAYLHAHEPQVVHGDLRGVNILIDDDGEPLLCDFGLAVVVEDLTHLPISTTLQNCGNPRWMAPELFTSEDNIVGPESDVWALGMVLLEITALVTPYYELQNSAQVIIHIHNGGRPVRPRGKDVIDRGLDDGLWALMQRCWTERPSLRPTASQALAVLENLAPKKLNSE